MKPLILSAMLLAGSTSAFAGDLPPKAASEVVDQIIVGMDRYFDPLVASRVQAILKANRDRYMALETRQAFASTVSADLYAETHDAHLKLGLTTLDAGRGARLSDTDQALADRYFGYGFIGARRLQGNIGYLRLHSFESSEVGAQRIDALLDLLKDTDALIIDLRGNRGGGGASDTELMGQISRTSIPMARITWRNEDGTQTVEQRVARPPKGGPLYADKPIFLLIDGRTFSAGEEFAYDLKAAGRATLVGTATGGGANPSNRNGALSYGLRIFIPNGHVEHPTTHGNWEGVGVSPDIPTQPGEALTAAYARALALTKPAVATPAIEKERAAALADPKAALLSDQAL